LNMALRIINLSKRLISRPVAELALAKEGGSILIITLWSLCLLATFAVILGYGTRQKMVLVHRLDERDKLRFIAEAGVKKAISQLKKRAETETETETERQYDSLNDDWSNNIGAFKQIRVADGRFDICYDYIDEQSAISETRYGLIDEERKLNINKASHTILRRLFRIVLDFDKIEAQELAASIVDWRDNDSQLSIPLGSAEDRYYRNLKHSYEAKDAEFEVLEEVLLVRGMAEDIFEKIKDYITIYGDGTININTASKQVLLALGLEKGVVDKILAFRSGENGIEANAYDNVFCTSSEIVPKLSQFYDMSDSEVAQLSNLVSEGSLVTNSNNFMIKSTARLNNKKGKAQVVCVVNRDGKILYWQES